MMCVFRRCHPGARSAIGSIAILVGVLCFTACGDDDSSFAPRPDDDSSIESSSSSVIPASSGDLRSSSSTNKKSSSSSAKSSSSDTSKSSGSVNSSSSLKIGCNTETGDNCEYGELLDERDGQTYKTTKIGDQVWMAQNLNYEMQDSYCYNDNESNCKEYGRLYTWKAALDACPTGWHLPSNTEWATLLDAVGERSAAGTKLKSTYSWTSNGNGTDDLSFSALPAGYRRDFGFYERLVYEAYFWSSSEYSKYYAYYIELLCNYDAVAPQPSNMDKDYGLSVRCLKDEEVPPVSSSSEIATSSSSSLNDISSSSVKSSSSSSAITPVYGDPLLDSRDGRSYKTVVIGNQIWMAEDLKYAPDSGNAAVGKHSWCYEDNDEYCEKYGRLYDWTAAVDTLNSDCGYDHDCEPFDEPRQGICPEGWHIPSSKEAAELKNVLSSAVNDDDFGFNLQLSGYRNIKGQTGSFDLGEKIIYWTIEQYTTLYGKTFNFTSSSISTTGVWSFKFDARSVRCLKDD